MGEALEFQVVTRVVPGQVLPAIAVYFIEAGPLATVQEVIPEVGNMASVSEAHSAMYTDFVRSLTGVHIEPPAPTFTEVMGLDALEEELRRLLTPHRFPLEVAPMRDQVVRTGIAKVMEWLTAHGHQVPGFGPYL